MKTNIAVLSVFAPHSKSEPMLCIGAGSTPELANSAAVAKVVTHLKSILGDEDDTGVHMLDPAMTPDELEAWFREWCACYASSVYNEEIDIPC